MPSKKRTIVIAMSIAVLLLITGFSLFSTRLTINGISEVTSSWKVYFESIEKTSVEGAATEASTPKIFNTTIEFEVNLRKPGDSITYTAVLKNGGTIGAIVNNIDASVTATESSTYTVTGIKKGDKLAAGASKEITIKVEYDRDYTAVPDEKTNDLIINIECVQDAGQTVTGEDLIIQKPKVIRANGDIDTVGTDLQIGNEHFYIISSDSTKVVALAKYNLDIDTGNASNTYKGTGIQDSHVIGDDNNYVTTDYGTLAFAGTNYWSSGCSSYPCDVYDANSNFYTHVENYKAYLENFGAKISNARLITYDELTMLGCNSSNNSCETAPSWVYSTAYYTGTAASSGGVWQINARDSFVGDSYKLEGGILFGARPVIEVPKSEISVNKKTIKIQANGDVTKVGTDIQIGDEHFYVISNSNGKITALAKYNLDINTGDTSTTYKGTGKQDSNVIGAKTGSTTYGTIAFSDRSWWDGSCTAGTACSYVYNIKAPAYTYVEKYKIYLESLGVNIINARLIKLDELSALGCTAKNSTSMNTCESALPWVFSTSYWTEKANLSNTIYVVKSDGSFTDDYYFTTNAEGIRPVIEIDASIFNVKANGDIDTVGTDIQIGDEHFYVISSDSSKVTALARYNLDVNAGDYIYKGTELQNPMVKGVLPGVGSKRYGTLAFSSTNYWSSTCTSYPCYVYNSSSILYTHVEKYKTYLNGLGASIKNARLISHEELTNLGCTISGGSSTCKNSSYAWIYSTSYWSGSAGTNALLINTDTRGDSIVGGYNYPNYMGVRPVIEIPKAVLH